MGALTAVSPVVWIVVLAVLAVAALGFLVWRIKSGSTGSAGVSLGAVGSHVSTLLSNPLVHRLAEHLVTSAQASHHAALDAGIAKFLPAASPFLPVVNSVADQIDAKITAALGVQASPTPAPATPASDPIAALEALLAQLKGKPTS